MARSISNDDDVIDSRDVIARIEELREQFADALAEYRGEDYEVTPQALQEFVKGEAEDASMPLHDDAVELRALEDFADNGSNSADDWEHGVALYRDSYFATHAQELADDLHGTALVNVEWPFTCIDWEQAARELQADYCSVEFDGVTYWVR